VKISDTNVAIVKVAAKTATAKVEKTTVLSHHTVYRLAKQHMKGGVSHKTYNREIISITVSFGQTAIIAAYSSYCDIS